MRHVCTQLRGQTCAATAGLKETCASLPLLACTGSHDRQHWVHGRTVCIKPPSFLAHPRKVPLAPSAYGARGAILLDLELYMEPMAVSGENSPGVSIYCYRNRAVLFLSVFAVPRLVLLTVLRLKLNPHYGSACVSLKLPVLGASFVKIVC